MSGATRKGSRSADVGSNAHVTVAVVYDVHKFRTCIMHTLMGHNEEKVSLIVLTAADVSPVVKRLGDLLGADRPPSLLEDTNLVLSPVTSSQLVPVNSSTPTPNSALLAEIGRLKAEVRAKTYELYVHIHRKTSPHISFHYAFAVFSLCVCVCVLCV